MNFNFNNIEIHHPWFLLLLAVIPVLIWYLHKIYPSKVAFIPVPSLSGAKEYRHSWKAFLYKILPYLKLLVLALFIMAMARPRLTLKQQSVNAEGIDIMLVMDVSTSMLAKDFNPDRLEAAKAVAEDFISRRKYDRIGLVIFAGEAFTFAPITTDHNLLKNFISQIRAGILKDGTAIGNGLAAAINRLKDSKAKSKIIILLTDGVNNAGYVSPETAVEMAKKYNIKVYTIGIGSKIQPSLGGFASMIFSGGRAELDEKLLKAIAAETGGKYFRAKNKNELEKIYDYIDKLEKTKIEVKVFKRYSEEFRMFLIPALILLLLILFLEKTILRTPV